MTRRSASLLALLATAPFAAADNAAAPATKTYSPLFVPVALEDRRAMSMDRPNACDSPYTVNSGVVQLEVAAFQLTHDRSIPGTPDTVNDTLAIGTTNTRIGLRDNWEVQVGVSPFVSARSKSNGAVTHDSGMGDTVIRSRYTIQGNDGTGLGLAVLPYVKLPTNQSDAGLFGNRKVEGGIEVPVGYALDAKTAVVAMGGAAFATNGKTAGTLNYDVNPFAAACVTRFLTDKLSMYGELYSSVNTGTSEGKIATSFDFGAGYQATTDMAFDLGMGVGLSEAASDLTVTAGVSFRF